MCFLSSAPRKRPKKNRQKVCGRLKVCLKYIFTQCFLGWQSVGGRGGARGSRLNLTFLKIQPWGLESISALEEPTQDRQSVGHLITCSLSHTSTEAEGVGERGKRAKQDKYRHLRFCWTGYLISQLPKTRRSLARHVVFSSNFMRSSSLGAAPGAYIDIRSGGTDHEGVAPCTHSHEKHEHTGERKREKKKRKEKLRRPKKSKRGQKATTKLLLCTTSNTQQKKKPTPCGAQTPTQVTVFGDENQPRKRTCSFTRVVTTHPPVSSRRGLLAALFVLKSTEHSIIPTSCLMGIRKWINVAKQTIM